MTMIPAQNLSQQHRYGGYGGGSGGGGGCGGGGGYSENYGVTVMSQIEEGYDFCNEACLESDLVVGSMAEDESRTESVNEAGSSSKDVQDEKDEGWLQLGIGSHANNHQNKLDQSDPTAQRNRLIELDLLPGGSSQQVRPSAPTIFHVPEFRAPRPVPNLTSFAGYGPSMFLQHPASSSNFPHHQEINWAFRPVPRNLTASSFSSSSSSSLMPPVPYFTRPIQLQAGVDLPGPSLDFRVIDPPRRPHSGLWFMLQASQNQ